MTESNHDHIIQQYPNDEEEVHLKDYLEVIWRRKWFIALTSSCIVLSVIAFTLMEHPVYQASALIQIQEEQSKSLDLKSMFDFSMAGMGQTEELLMTEQEVFKSRPVLQKAAAISNQRMVLDTGKPLAESYWQKVVAKFNALFQGQEAAAGPGAMVAKEHDPLRIQVHKVANLLQPLSLTLTLSPDGHFSLTDEDGANAGQGRIGQVCSTDYFSFTLEGSPPDVTTTYPLLVRPEESAISFVRDHLTVSPVRNTKMLRLKFSTAYPDQAQNVLSSIIQAYQEQKINQKTQTASKALDFLKDQIELADRQLTQATSRLKEYKTKHPLITVPESVKQSAEQLTEIEQNLHTLKRQEKEARFLLSNLRREDPLDSDSLYSLGSAIGQEAIQSLGEELNKLQVQRAALLNHYTSRHPRVKAVDTQIAKLKDQIQAELQSAIQSLTKQQQVVRKEMDQIKGQFGELPEAQQRLVDLQRQVSINEQTYSFLLEKKGELQITKASQSGNFWLVEPAHLLAEFAEPQAKRNVLLSVVLGLMLGVGGAFFWTYMDDRLHTPKDIERLTHLPTLASISHFEAKPGKSEIPVPDDLIVYHTPMAPAAEAFRTLRTGLLFTSVDTPRRVFMFTSSLPNAGKSTCISNLAAAMAQAGQQVLLIDADLRKPTMHKIFECQSQPGLVNTLMADDLETALTANVQSTPQDNLWILTSGNIPPTPNELLSSEKMASLIDLARDQYNYVLLDVPPTFAASDSLVLGQRVDGILYIMRSGYTRRSTFLETMKSFAALGDKMVGIVVNDVDYKKERYYYYHYQYYYKSGYGYGEEKGKGRKKRRK